MKSVLAAMAAVLLLTVSSSALCATPRRRLVCAEYFHEQTVVIAKLVRSRHVVPRGEDADEYDRYTMQTTEVLRGRITARFVIVQELNSGRAAIDWNTDESYLLFLSYLPRYNAWALDRCSNADVLELAGHTLQTIRQHQACRHTGRSSP